MRIRYHKRNEKSENGVFSVSRDNPSMQFACLAGFLKMAENLSLLFELFEEVLADDLPQEQVLLGADEGAVLFLLVAGQLGRKEDVRAKNFYQITVPSYVLEDFRSHFRMSRSTVTVLEDLLSVHNDISQYTDHGGRPPVELRRQILTTLWILKIQNVYVLLPIDLMFARQLRTESTDELAKL